MVYICLVTCSSTRVVHIQIVEERIDEAFLRFVGRRSSPEAVISENATTLDSSCGHFETFEVNKSFDGAPKYVGWWEWLMSMTKTTLRKVFGGAHITLNTVHIIFAEVESALNNQSVTNISIDINVAAYPISPLL